MGCVSEQESGQCFIWLNTEVSSQQVRIAFARSYVRHTFSLSLMAKDLFEN